MPITSIIGELGRARRGGYAIPLFGFFEMNAVEGVIRAAEEASSPVILGIYTNMIDADSVEASAAYIRRRAEGCKVPVSLFLDHGQSYEQCIRAMAFGFTDVMFDGSRLPFEENMEITRLIVRAAHAVGAGVEAELGHVGMAADEGGDPSGLTDPDSVRRFVAETGVDSLAISIGTAHGVYRGTPRLDFDLLSRIASVTDIPLVMHGGSGLTEEQFRRAVAGGMAKINIATDLFQASTAAMREKALQEADYGRMVEAVASAHYERSLHYFKLFGSVNAVGRRDMR